MDSVDVWNTPLVRDELEVDKVDLEKMKSRDMMERKVLKLILIMVSCLLEQKL